MADNTYTNAAAMVNAGAANKGEAGIATFSHGLVSVDGTLLAQVTAGGLLVGADGTSPIGGPNNPAPVTLTTPAPAGTVTLTADPTKHIQYNKLTFPAGNMTLAITGATAGMRGQIILQQDSVGSRTLTYPAGSLKTAGAITLTTAANAKDVLTWHYDGTNFFWSAALAFA